MPKSTKKPIYIFEISLILKWYKRSIVKNQLIKSIKEKEIQLAKLKEHADKSVVCSDLYNKVVLEKAILKKQLEDLDKNKVVSIMKNLLPRKKVLICDYFKK